MKKMLIGVFIAASALISIRLIYTAFVGNLSPENILDVCLVFFLLLMAKITNSKSKKDMKF